MIKAANKIISYLKGEEFNLDDSLPLGYFCSFLSVRLFAYLKYIVVFQSFKLGFVGKRTVVLASKLIHHRGNLSIANDCHIDALSKNGIVLGSNVSIQKRVVIECSGSLRWLGKGLIVGDNVGIGSGSFLGCAGGVEIDSDTIIGNFVSIHSENHNFSETDKPIRLQGVNHKGIQIGRDCWIGAKVTILDGTILGDGCVVAAGAVLNGKTYPDYSVIGGIPAKVISSRLRI